MAALCELYSAAWVCSGKIPEINQVFGADLSKLLGKVWRNLTGTHILTHCVWAICCGSWYALDASSGTWCKCDLHVLSGLPAPVPQHSLESGEVTVPWCRWCNSWILLLEQFGGWSNNKEIAQFLKLFGYHKPSLYKWWQISAFQQTRSSCTEGKYKIWKLWVICTENPQLKSNSPFK